MTELDSAGREEWTALLSLPASERVSKMIDVYSELADLEAEERNARIRVQVRLVYSRPDEDVLKMTDSRLRAWLMMDPAKAAIVGSDFTKAIDAMPVEIAERRSAILRQMTASLTEDERRRLNAIVPGIFGIDPGSPTPAQASPWWAFWRRFRR